MRERAHLLRRRSTSFGYTLSDLKGPLAPLVVWCRRAVVVPPGGYRHPRDVAVDDSPPVVGVRAGMLPAFGKLWMGYARRSLEELSDHLV